MTVFLAIFLAWRFLVAGYLLNLLSCFAVFGCAHLFCTYSPSSCASGAAKE